ncbi:MAG: B12-binding domain-containing radical SAM protein, partial [Bacteroidaceae bacterium]|nr:B12-binding domain-containing radical SAM protein [Bacteroidaceae bacterium]
EATVAWIEAGMSLRKTPAEHVVRGRLQPPADWQVLYGVYDESLRLCHLSTGSDGQGYWFGYDSTSQRPAPIFKAFSQKS